MTVTLTVGRGHLECTQRISLPAAGLKAASELYTSRWAEGNQLSGLSLSRWAEVYQPMGPVCSRKDPGRLRARSPRWEPGTRERPRPRQIGDGDPGTGARPRPRANRGRRSRPRSLPSESPPTPQALANPSRGRGRRGPGCPRHCPGFHMACHHDAASVSILSENSIAQGP